MSTTQLREKITELTHQISGRQLDQELETWLNKECGVDSEIYQQIKDYCQQGSKEGWLCQHEAGGVRFGRVFKPSDDLHRFSVDVVEMKDIIGPHHSHPTGEIDLIMPLDEEALFDERAAGWMVYPPGSAHKPTVSNGRALVLYLLPEGQIKFTR